MPAWKRWLGAVLFTVGGGLCAAWGIHDIAAWIGSLYRGDRMIETESMRGGRENSDRSLSGFSA